MARPTDSAAVQRSLTRFGYTLEWAGEAGARTCSIVSTTPPERWDGQGADDGAAFEAALGKLAPAYVTRILLERDGREAAASGTGEVALRAESTSKVEADLASISSKPRDMRAILADLQLVAARVESGIPEAALMAPPLQKLHVLAWIARARMLEQEANRSRSASDVTGAIARRLTVLCKTWWPGSVRALQLDATPDRAAREQGLPGASRWIEVAEAAEARLEALIAEPPSDDGWRDGAVLSPPPEDPQRELATAIKIIERIVAPIDSIPPNEAPRPLASTDEVQLEDAAARLRWCRQVAPDPGRWGAAVGRLRWLAAHKRGGPRLNKLLDPFYAPRPSWSTEAGSSRSRLVALTTPPDGKTEFLAWLVAVFDALDGPTLATRLPATRTASGQPVLPMVMEVQESDLPKGDRRLRRRLRQLQELLSGGAAASKGGEPGQEIGGAPPPEAEDGPSRPTFDELIFTRVRAKLPTANVLFVSNREDPMLRERLEKALGWEVEWSTAEPRRISSIAASIGRGKYKVVLSATGFQDHSTDIALARAAASSSTLYVRVNRGRVAACARALARELGIRTDEMLAEAMAS